MPRNTWFTASFVAGLVAFSAFNVPFAFSQEAGGILTSGSDATANSSVSGNELRERIRTSIGTKNYKIAIADIKCALSASPDDAQLHGNLAYCFLNAGELLASIEEGSIAVKMEPSNFCYWLNLAGAYQSNGQLSEAENALREILKRFPDNEQRSSLKDRIKSLQKAIAERGDGATANPAIVAKQQSSMKKWRSNRMPLRIYIEDGDNVEGYRDSLKMMLVEAFEVWAERSQGRVSFIFTDNENQSDIQCGWTNNPRKFENSSESGEATVSFDQTGIIQKAQILLLTKPVNSSTMSDEQAREICLHEVGHALGLKHSFEHGDIMYFSSRLQPLSAPSSNDLNTLVTLYSRNDPPLSRYTPVASFPSIRRTR